MLWMMSWLIWIFPDKSVYYILYQLTKSQTMKNVLLPILLVLATGLGCEKTTQVPNKDIPHWLEEIIAEAEKELISDPNAIVGNTGWIQYEFQGLDYYQNDIPFSSYFPHLYTQDGEVASGAGFSLNDYFEHRCCKRVIWKGPNYQEIR